MDDHLLGMSEYLLSIVRELWPQGNWRILGNWGTIGDGWREVSIVGYDFGFDCNVKDEIMLIRRLGHGTYCASRFADHESVINAFKEAIASLKLT
jgi:hypothetical protein